MRQNSRYTDRPGTTVNANDTISSNEGDNKSYRGFNIFSSRPLANNLFA